MGIFAVTTTIPTTNGQFVWFPFECKAESVPDFWSLIRDEGAVLGIRYRTERRTRRLIEPEDRIITLDGVAAVGLYKRVANIKKATEE